ncbi:GAF domain-containing protein [Spirosoma sp. HMF3257]|uniref:Sensor histidine kinase n=1 Tax=Spirosoma telluris TaxID=2183553 RepID=A0A327NJT4_9BACT|nr:GAF domain-containing protein [Spirosoma telluris]RAI74649.1 sensor histidine kinase [Spirosoma telluris]
MGPVASDKQIVSRPTYQQSLKDELEVERIINFFAMSLLDQTTVEEVLWDVAKNCIARLNFVDCVVYRLDEERRVLVQKAAHGPKSPSMGVIQDPIEIPVGQGIVGEVARTGQPERIGNTSLDKRYIADDAVRYSEITVPILLNGRVWGVIDAEHPKRHFFRPHHLTVLTKVAALCAQKIRRVETEVAYRHAQQQLSDNNRRVAEAKLLALRMQMNPHFVFNSLNAINKFVLQNDSEQASRYLTKFARLVRQVLANTQTDWVSLRDELTALQSYIELEQLRSDDHFDVTVRIDPKLSADSVQVPPLLIQPYIENAIRHGLLAQQNRRAMLTIDCKRIGNRLAIAITDNGIGREAAISNRPQNLNAHQFHGSRIAEERVVLVNDLYDVDARIDCQDLIGLDGQPDGTCITFTMNLKTQ